MRIPRRVTVKGQVWRVRVTDRFPERVRQWEKDEGMEVFGYCQELQRTLWVKRSQSPLERFSTFWHELLHAICFEYGIKRKVSHRAIHALEAPLAITVAANRGLDGRRARR